MESPINSPAAHWNSSRASSSLGRQRLCDGLGSGGMSSPGGSHPGSLSEKPPPSPLSIRRGREILPDDVVRMAAGWSLSSVSIGRKTRSDDCEMEGPAHRPTRDLPATLASDLSSASFGESPRRITCLPDSEHAPIDSGVAGVGWLALGGPSSNILVLLCQLYHCKLALNMR